MNAAIETFRVATQQTELAQLRDRLANARWPEAETVSDWSQGTPLHYLRDICAYWASEYDWRKAEAQLNAQPGFRTALDGIEIHFLHVRSPEPNALPLILTHGWPGSIFEFMQAIGPLSDPVAHGGRAEDAFHLVIPSLPGYGFSGKPCGTGWSTERIARAWSALMARLGYQRFAAQGGDWGAMVTTAIGVQEPERCVGIHVNMPLVGPDRATVNTPTEIEQAALEARQYYLEHDSGYAKIQSTRPQTIGYGLVDSPIALAAWIIEKFHRWTDCGGDVESVLTRDQMLDNITLYWLTASGASSARLYWESFNALHRDPVKVPSGISMFPKEIFRTSERWAKRRYQNLVYWNEPAIGGHFACFEQPDIFVAELRQCFALMRR